MKFLILSLPRSRTYWLSQVLCCGHDEIIHPLQTLPEGSIESGVIPFWRLIPPGIKVVTIRRDLDRVIQSLNSLGIWDAEKHIRYIDHKLNQIERRIPGTLSIRYDDLDNEFTLRRIAHHCGISFNQARWETLKNKNLQSNIEVTRTIMIANRERLLELASDMKEAMLWQLKTKS